MSWWWIFPAFFLTFFLVRVVVGPRWGWCGWGYAYPHPAYANGYVEPREELRQRLARGDITPEEYERRMGLLR